jgi:hypothetical protein
LYRYTVGFVLKLGTASGTAAWCANGYNAYDASFDSSAVPRYGNSMVGLYTV